MIVMLTVMSGIDHHTISETWVVFGYWLGVGESYCLGQSTAVDFVVWSMLHFEVKR
jgi:hypothetical protein